MTDWSHEDEQITELLRRLYALAPHAGLAVTAAERELVQQAEGRHLHEARRRGRPRKIPRTTTNNKETPTMHTIDHEAELLAAVRAAGCNRLHWGELPAIAASLSPQAFLGRNGRVDAFLVEDWAERTLPRRNGPTLAMALALAGRLDGNDDVRQLEPMVDEDGVALVDVGPDWSTCSASLVGLVYGYPEGGDDV